MYATPTDVAGIWRPLTSTEHPIAENLCAAASRLVDVEIPDLSGRVAGGYISVQLVADIVASMVKRAMLGSERDGVESQSEAAGPFSRQQRFANPDGALYLTSAERGRLGGAGSIRVKVGWLA